MEEMTDGWSVIHFNLTSSTWNNYLVSNYIYLEWLNFWKRILKLLFPTSTLGTDKTMDQNKNNKQDGPAMLLLNNNK